MLYLPIQKNTVGSHILLNWQEIVLSIRAFVFHDNCNGSPNQNDVKPDVPVADVPSVHLDAFFIGRIAAAAGLPHAGDAGGGPCRSL